MVMMMSDCAATSRGEAATCAPAWASGSARDAVRFQTVTGKPALRILPAIGPPMIPSPIKPTRSVTRTPYGKD